MYLKKSTLQMIICFLLLFLINSVYASEPMQHCYTFLNLLNDKSFEQEPSTVYFNTNPLHFPNNLNTTDRTVCENYDRTSSMYEANTIRTSYHERDGVFKKTTWNSAAGCIETVNVTDHALLLNLFCIRTFNDRNY